VTATGVAINKEGAGVLEMKNIRAGTLNVDAGTVRVLPANGFNTPASKVTALTVAPTAKLDLAGAPLAIDYAGASPVTNVRSLLQSGYAHGSWTGNGITSSAAAAAASGVPSHILGARADLVADESGPVSAGRNRSAGSDHY